MEQGLLPLIERLEGASAARLALHIGGTIVDHLEGEARELIPRIQALVASERLELVAGPFYGAPLCSVPEQDAVSQLQLNVDWIRARIDARVRGCWLPTQGWDPVLPRLLARAGLGYTMLDKRLLPWTEPGWVAVERDGHTVGVLPTDHALAEALMAGDKLDLRRLLRSRMDSSPGLICATIPLVRPSHQGSPTGWLGPALDLMRDEASWLRAMLPTMVLATGPGGHRAAPISGLRPEVGAESLPKDAADQPTAIPWSRFLVRSDDANRLHKRMLRVSRQVQRMRAASRNARRRHLAERQVQEASLDLYQGQSAALFMPSPRGDLERSDVRHTAWVALARAEERARAELGVPASPHTVDMDGDGVPEVYVSTPALDALVRPAQGGAMAELSLPGVGNLLNSLQRQRPTWDEIVDREARLPQLVSGPGLVAVEADEVEIEDITGVFVRTLDENADTQALRPHDEITEVPDACGGQITIPPDLDDLLVDDTDARLAFQERFPGPELHTDNIARAQAPELGDFVGGRYQLVRAESSVDGEQVVILTRDGQVRTLDGIRMVRITKRFAFPPDATGVGVHYDVINRYSDPVHTRFGVEINLNLDGQRGESRGIEVRVADPTDPDGVRTRTVALEAAATIDDVVEVCWRLDDHGRRVWLTTPTAAKLYVVPVDSVYWAQHGFMRASQGHCLLFVWELELWGDERKRFDLSLRVETRGSSLL